jgi:hypothetical protein
MRIPARFFHFGQSRTVVNRLDPRDLLVSETGNAIYRTEQSFLEPGSVIPRGGILTLTLL